MITFNNCGCDITDACYDKTKTNEFLLRQGNKRFPIKMWNEDIVEPNNNIIVSERGEYFKQALISTKTKKKLDYIPSEPILKEIVGQIPLDVIQNSLSKRKKGYILKKRMKIKKKAKPGFFSDEAMFANL